MASSKEYLAFILGQLSELEDVTYRAMMGEFILYYRGKIVGGMIPKVKGCIQAIEAGVNKVHIIDGRVPHCLLLEIFTDHGIGTMITK